MLMAGPAVSLKGSPTVSPTTPALWLSLPFAAVIAGLDILLGVVPRTAGVGHVDGHEEACDGGAGQQAHNALEAQDHTHYDGG